MESNRIPMWLGAALLEIGVKERPGDQENPRIVEYHSTTTLRATKDEVPWCSAFANWCMKQAGVKGTGSAAARSWLKWGHGLDAPQYGCVVVMSRGNSPTSGHVGFFVENFGDDYIRVIGGNQANQVKVSTFPKSLVLGYRWPNE